MKTRFKPAGSYVLIERLSAEKVSEGGIHIPDSSSHESNGIIVAAGPEADPIVKENIGATLVFAVNAAKNMKGMKENQALVRGEDIFGVVLSAEVSSLPKE